MTRTPFFRPFFSPRCGAEFSAAVHERQREAARRGPGEGDLVTWRELKPGDLVEALDEYKRVFRSDAHVFGVVTEIDPVHYVWAVWEQNAQDAENAFLNSTTDGLKHEEDGGYAMPDDGNRHYYRIISRGHRIHRFSSSGYSAAVHDRQKGALEPSIHGRPSNIHVGDLIACTPRPELGWGLHAYYFLVIEVHERYFVGHYGDSAKDALNNMRITPSNYSNYTEFKVVIPAKRATFSAAIHPAQKEAATWAGKEGCAVCRDNMNDEPGPSDYKCSRCNRYMCTEHSRYCENCQQDFCTQCLKHGDTVRCNDCGMEMCDWCNRICLACADDLYYCPDCFEKHDHGVAYSAAIHSKQRDAVTLPFVDYTALRAGDFVKVYASGYTPLRYGVVLEIQEKHYKNATLKDGIYGMWPFEMDERTTLEYFTTRAYRDVEKFAYTGRNCHFHILQRGLDISEYSAAVHARQREAVEARLFCPFIAMVIDELRTGDIIEDMEERNPNVKYGIVVSEHTEHNMFKCRWFGSVREAELGAPRINERETTHMPFFPNRFYVKKHGVEIGTELKYSAAIHDRQRGAFEVLDSCDGCGKATPPRYLFGGCHDRDHDQDETPWYCSKCTKDHLCAVCNMTYCDEHIFKCVCGKKICYEDGYPCQGCGERVCKDCERECKYPGCHRGVLCKECVLHCDEGGHDVCLLHGMFNCDHCGNNVCNEHLVNHRAHCYTADDNKSYSAAVHKAQQEAAKEYKVGDIVDWNELRVGDLVECQDDMSGTPYGVVAVIGEIPGTPPGPGAQITERDHFVWAIWNSTVYAALAAFNNPDKDITKNVGRGGDLSARVGVVHKFLIVSRGIARMCAPREPLRTRGIARPLKYSAAIHKKQQEATKNHVDCNELRVGDLVSCERPWSLLYGVILALNKMGTVDEDWGLKRNSDDVVARWRATPELALSAFHDTTEPPTFIDCEYPSGPKPKWKIISRGHRRSLKYSAAVHERQREALTLPKNVDRTKLRVGDLVKFINPGLESFLGTTPYMVVAYIGDLWDDDDDEEPDEHPERACIGYWAETPDKAVELYQVYRGEVPRQWDRGKTRCYLIGRDESKFDVLKRGVRVKESYSAAVHERQKEAAGPSAMHTAEERREAKKQAEISTEARKNIGSGKAKGSDSNRYYLSISDEYLYKDSSGVLQSASERDHRKCKGKYLGVFDTWEETMAAVDDFDIPIPDDKDDLPEWTSIEVEDRFVGVVYEKNLVEPSSGSGEWRLSSEIDESDMIKRMMEKEGLVFKAAVHDRQKEAAMPRPRGTVYDDIMALKYSLPYEGIGKGGIGSRMGGPDAGLYASEGGYDYPILCALCGKHRDDFIFIDQPCSHCGHHKVVLGPVMPRKYSAAIHERQREATMPECVKVKDMRVGDLLEDDIGVAGYRYMVVAVHNGDSVQGWWAEGPDKAIDAYREGKVGANRFEDDYFAPCARIIARGLRRSA